MYRIRLVFLCLSAAVAARFAGDARAACNLIPSASKTFRSTLGATSRPFAAPGEFVEVAIDPTRCDGASGGLLPTAAEHVVSIVFTPAGAAARKMVVLSPVDCSTPAVQSALAACPITPSCRSLQSSDLGIVTRDGEPRLAFRFPDTDAEFAGPADGLGLAGPAIVAVTRSGDPLPCGLLASGAICTGQTGVRACVDQLFAADGTCRPNPDATFPYFTALPTPNNYQADCFQDAPPCTATATQARVAVDAAGNLLLPVHWQGILEERNGVPVPRILHATLKPPVPFTVPSQAFLASYTPEGQPLPPIFEPAVDPALPPGLVALVGSADAPYTVLRINRRFGVCQGGDDSGSPCTVDRDCFAGTCPLACVGGSTPGAACTSNANCLGGGTCGALFPNFGAATGGGPFVMSRATPGFCQLPPHAACANAGGCPAPGDTCVTYAFEARTPIPLESLTACSGDVCGFTVLESVDLKDRNGDGDTVDAVATLRPRSTFAGQALGAPDGFAPGGAPLPACGLTGNPEGRALEELVDEGFVIQSATTRGDVLAFLESEAGQNACDENGDFDRDDAILRVFTLGPTEATGGFAPAHVVDAEPLIDRRNVVVSGGLAFARRSEEGQARNLTGRASVATGGTEATGHSSAPSLSAASRFVAFHSDAIDLVPGDGNGQRDVFVHDRQTGVTERVSEAMGGGDGDGSSEGPAISAAGRFVAFSSGATNLVAGDGNGANDVFVRDRQAGTTERVSVAFGGGDADASSTAATISADGNVVVFLSTATNLVAGDGNGIADLFLYDRQAGTTERVSVTTDGAQVTSGTFGVPTVTGDGRLVFFDTDAALLEFDSGARDIYMYDRATGHASFVSPINCSCGDFFTPVVTPDGRYLAFTTTADLGFDDSNGVLDVYVLDRLAASAYFSPTRVSGGSASGGSNDAAPAVSADGRRVAFLSAAPDLVSGDANSITDVFVRDLLVNVTRRVSVATSGGEAGHSGDFLEHVTMSAAGGAVAFDSTADDLVPGDTNGVLDVFVRAGDPTDTASDVTGDGDFDDTVLEIVDPVAVTARLTCPAKEVVTAGGAAGFLRPEAQGATPALPGCPPAALVGGLPDLDGNGSTNDLVVHSVTPGGPVENLARAAGDAATLKSICVGGFRDGSPCDRQEECNTGTCTPAGRAGASIAIAAVCDGGSSAGRSCDTAADCPGAACAPAWVAALVSEAAEGVNLNGDGDMSDNVLEVHRLADPPSEWANVGEAADRLGACGGRVVLITPEAAQSADRNGDGDQDDRVLQVYDPATGTLTDTQQAALEFVCNDGFVAFRTPEWSQGSADLNEDGDQEDPVVQVYDFTTATVRNTHQPARVCSFDACDPRFPYRVSPGSVKFLTFECDTTGPDHVPGDDLCGFGTDLNDDGDPDDLVLQVYDVATGITRPIFEPTSGDPFQGGGHSQTPDPGIVYVSSGRCLEPVGESCRTNADCTQPGTHCVLATGPRYDFCFDDADCGPTRVCDGNSCKLGVCRVDGCATDADCPAGTECSAGICLRDQGVCATDADCPPAIGCWDQTIVPASPDSDVDGIPDHIDNCPFDANTAQTDTDGDRVGDACDLATCGNGVAEAPDERCDGLDGACPGSCTAGCACPATACPNVLPRRPGTVLVKSRDGAGRLRIDLAFELGTYAGEPLTIELEDGDGPIAEATLSTLTLTTSGRLWRFKADAPGVQRVRLRTPSPSKPGRFSLHLLARQWFAAAAANQPAADTRVTIRVGAQCFTHVVTRKLD